MNTNTGSTHRLHGLPAPIAASIALAANAWAAVPANRGSPQGRYGGAPGQSVAQAAGQQDSKPAAADRNGRPS